MSWYGSHPDISKAAVKKLLPPRACKWCVYRVRYLLGETWEYLDGIRIAEANGKKSKCGRCGVSYDAFALKQHAIQDLGILTDGQNRVHYQGTETLEFHPP